MFWTDDLGRNDPKVLVACPTYAGMAYSLKQWAEAFHAFDYPEGLKGALMVDNSDENLHYTHLIRAQGIPAVYQTKRFNFLWDTLELSWRTIAEYAHDNSYDLIWSVEADVVCEPSALRKMVEYYKQVGPRAILSHRYHPRGLDNPQEAENVVLNEERLEKLKKECWFDTLGCTMFPTELAWENRDKWMAIFEVEIYLQARDRGYERHRLKDLISIQHLEDPERGTKLAVPRPWANRAHGAELEKVEDHVARPIAALPEGAHPSGNWHGRRNDNGNSITPQKATDDPESLDKQNQRMQVMVNSLLAENERLRGGDGNIGRRDIVPEETPPPEERVDLGGDRSQFVEPVVEAVNVEGESLGRFKNADEARQAIKWDCLSRAAVSDDPDEMRKRLEHKDLLINQLFAEVERLKGEDRSAVR